MAAIELVGMWGLGDVIMSRAVIRELMKSNTIFLVTHNTAAFLDLIDQGLRISQIRARPSIRESVVRQSSQILTITPAPPGTHRRQINYTRDGGALDIGRNGSILAAQFTSAGITMPERPDFSMSIPDEWRANARKLIDSWPTGGKPLMVARPIVLNQSFLRPTRNPDPDSYVALYNSIREKFFTVGVAEIDGRHEWLAPGAQPQFDMDLTKGQLDFETLAALFAEADLVFTGAGFGPVLAHAVHTPVVVVYGGHESSHQTQAPTMHLAPTLAIDTDHPCNCQSGSHDCDKTITMPPALEKLSAFVGRLPARPKVNASMPRTLIFACTWTPHGDPQRLPGGSIIGGARAERAKLLDYWLTKTIALNPGCDILLVDTPDQNEPSPIDPKHGEWVPYTPGLQAPRMKYVFPDNIGHLCFWRRGHRDGWGRAFTFGVDAAVSTLSGLTPYEYVAHIEGDSIFRHPIAPIIRKMQRDKIEVMSAQVDNGHPHRRPHPVWVETGLMFMNTNFLAAMDFTKRYNWAGAKTDKPAPEERIYQLFGKHLRLMPWRVFRGHQNAYTHANIINLDWITHASDPTMYDRFMEFTGPLPMGESAITLPLHLRPVHLHLPDRNSGPMPRNPLIRRQWERALQERGVKA